MNLFRTVFYVFVTIEGVRMYQVPLSSWESYPSLQIPTYPDLTMVRTVQKQLRQHPPLVFAGEIRNLRNQLCEVYEGKSFIFQAGPCAEEFGGGGGIQWTEDIRSLFFAMVQCSLILSFGMEKKIIRIGRMAGQYAKPRSEEFESDGYTLTYRGDIIHGMDMHDRTPDPRRMTRAYFESVCTLNVLRSLSKSGDLDLHQLDQWLDPFVHEISYYQHEEFDRLLRKWLVFLGHCGLPLQSVFREPEFFISHEALLLYYEDALTRIDASTGHSYNGGAHTIWLGERTRHSEAHLHYLASIENPIGIKVGPSSDPMHIRQIVRQLNPLQEKGKIMIIIRMGDQLSHKLPFLFESLQGEPVLYMSDPCHANTIRMEGRKTRLCSSIHEELLQFFYCCHEHQVIPAGVHIEMSGDWVTECIGQNVTASSLSKRYLTRVDPRLNRYQAFELAFFLSSLSNKISPTIRRF